MTLATLYLTVTCSDGDFIWDGEPRDTELYAEKEVVAEIDGHAYIVPVELYRYPEAGMRMGTWAKPVRCENVPRAAVEQALQHV